MTVSKRIFLVSAVAIGLGAAGSMLVQAQSSQVLGELTDKEGLYVDVKEFKIHKGRAGGKAAGQLAMLDAREVSEGAIILRVGDKLYLVDTKPQGSTPQAMKDFWDSIPMPMR